MYLALAGAILLAALYAPGAAAAEGSGAAAAPPTGGNFLHTEGAKIVDSQGKEVLISGVNWFGMETNTLSPHGLWARNLDDMLDQIASLGYNTIRLPFTNEIFNPDLKPTAIDYRLNPDLEGLSALELMDRVIAGAGKRGIRVILDRHRSTTDGQDKLWYNDEVSEEKWIADWQLLAERYKGNDTVIGADIHNEPAGDTTWGTGDVRTDWRLAAERCGNAIHEVNPDWLILVEGIEKTEDDFGGVLGWYWMGGSLQYARQYPVRLKVPNKLVYSPHDYGPGVWELQGWFMDPEFPDNLPETWDYHWGYLQKENIAPVIVGEFGGRSVGDDTEGKWQRRLVSYLKENGIGYTYWSFNGNSGDTGGILADDWTSIHEDKQAVLDTHKGEMATIRNPAVVNATATERVQGEWRDVKLLHKDEQKEKWVKELRPVIHVANKTTAEMDISNLEIRYWFTAEGKVAETGDNAQKVRVVGGTVGYDKQLDTSKVRAELVRDEANDRGEGDVYYVRLTFAPGTMAPARDTLGIELAISRGDGGTYFQDNDYSHREYHWQTQWDRIAGYRNGKLFWGKEPQTFYAEEKAKMEERERKLAEKAEAVRAGEGVDAAAASPLQRLLDALNPANIFGR